MSPITYLKTDEETTLDGTRLDEFCHRPSEAPSTCRPLTVTMKPTERSRNAGPTSSCRSAQPFDELVPVVIQRQRHRDDNRRE